MDRQKLLVAVSGGVDSVVLLDILVKAKQHSVTVAHFDHGIRSDSAADARFVEELAGQYGVPFVGVRQELGSGASEELARNARYGFLFREAKARNAVIATAHHMDDVVESIAINLVRGTGWRGVAVLNRAGLVRPLLSKTKAEIRQYACERRLEWVEDSTNATQIYMRNRLRSVIASMLPIAKKLQLAQLRAAQSELKEQIEKESDRLLVSSLPYSRYFFTQIDTVTACELLRRVVTQETGAAATRPQLERALLAIKTAKPSERHDIGMDRKLMFTARTFVVEKS